jgi:plastocyanin
VRRGLIAVVAAGALAAPAAAPAGAAPATEVGTPFAGAAAAKEVVIYDDYYLPARLTVPRGTLVRWRWPEAPIDVHDVKLRSGPPGVPRFQSEPASAGYVFKRRLRKPGRYRIVCTLHEEMTMTIRVRR